MPKRTEFVEHVIETMRVFGPVEARAMFGGWGIYHQGVFFALILEDALYLKTDDGSRAEFEARGLEPCTYRMKGGDTIVMHYFAAPEEALDDPAEMARWARSGYGAALRAASAKATRSRARPKRPAARRRN